MATAPISGTNAAPVRGRSTRQRAAVAAALDEVDEFRSAQDLHDVLKHRGDSVGLTTVYRTLQSLADAGEVDVLRTDDGEAVYRRCSHRRPPPPSGVPRLRQGRRGRGPGGGAVGRDRSPSSTAS